MTQSKGKQKAEKQINEQAQGSSRLEQGQDRVSSLERELDQTRARAARLQVANDTLVNQNNALFDENNRLTNQNNELTNENTALADQNTELFNQNTELIDDNVNLAEENDTLAEEAANAVGLNAALRNVCLRKRAELEQKQIELERNRVELDRLAPEMHDASLTFGIKGGTKSCKVAIGATTQYDFSGRNGFTTRPSIAVEVFPFSDKNGGFMGASYRNKKHSASYHQNGLFTKARDVTASVGYNELRFATTAENATSILAFRDIAKQASKGNFMIGAQLRKEPRLEKTMLDVQASIFSPKSVITITETEPRPAATRSPSLTMRAAADDTFVSGPTATQETVRLDVLPLGSAERVPEVRRNGIALPLVLAGGAICVILVTYWNKLRKK